MAQIISIPFQGPSMAELYEVAMEDLGKSHFIARDLNLAIREFNRAPQEPELAVVDFGWLGTFNGAAHQERSVSMLNVPVLAISSWEASTVQRHAGRINLVGIIANRVIFDSRFTDICGEFFKLKESLTNEDKVTHQNFAPFIEAINERPKTQNTRILGRATERQAAHEAALK